MIDIVEGSHQDYYKDSLDTVDGVYRDAKKAENSLHKEILRDGVSDIKKMHNFIKDTLDTYLKNKVTPEYRQQKEKYFDETLANFQNTSDPYTATCTRLMDEEQLKWQNNETEGYNKVLATKIVYMLKLMAGMKKQGKVVDYDLRKQLPFTDWDLIGEDVILDPKGIAKIQEIADQQEMKIVSFVDVLNVYSATFAAYQMNKMDQE